jgi:light-regulated signal transduction histidine kinase (bacteriophytochrome)
MAAFFSINALICAAAAVRARSVYMLAKGTRLASRWAILTSMLSVFVVLYVVALVASTFGKHDALLPLMGFIALGGSTLVFAVVHLGFQSISSLNYTLLDQKVEQQKTEGMLQELMLVNEQIVRSNIELEQFAYLTSHDLQEPLRKITAFGDLLAETEAERLSDEGKDHIQRMQKAARRMSELISALLSFSRLSREKERTVEVDLNVLLAEIVEDLEIAIKKAGATVHVAPLPPVEGRPIQLRQLFQNLLGNALKFRREGTAHEVRVESKLEAGRLLIVITDNGVGFEPQYAERIFKIFQRLHGRNAFEGTGIGLAVCQRVAVNHGWKIRAIGRPNEGATFELDLGKGEAA